MKKASIFLFVALFSLAGFAEHSSCKQFTNNAIKLFKITKSYNPGNILWFSAAVNQKTCTFKNGNSSDIVAYWEMGEKNYYNPTCEAPTRLEKKSLRVDYYRKISSQKIKVQINYLNKIADDIPGLTKTLEIKLFKSGSTCKAQAIGKYYNESIVLEKAHGELGGLIGTSLESFKIIGKTISGSYFSETFDL